MPTTAAKCPAHVAGLHTHGQVFRHASYCGDVLAYRMPVHVLASLSATIDLAVMHRCLVMCQHRHVQMCHRRALGELCSVVTSQYVKVSVGRGVFVRRCGLAEVCYGS